VRQNASTTRENGQQNEPKLPKKNQNTPGLQHSTSDHKNNDILIEKEQKTRQ
jgi:hypothetical protein